MRVKRGFYCLLVLLPCAYIYFKLQPAVPKNELHNEPTTRHVTKIAPEVPDDLLADIGIVKSEIEHKKREKGYLGYSLNVLVSDRLPLNRTIPDTRHKRCTEIGKDTIHLNATVLITFHNEATSTLLRTITSVLNRTPKHLLKEIILFDDYSDLIDLKAIQSFVSSHKEGLLKLIRSGRREGLIRGKLYASRAATGDVLVFLDSHCEVNEMWLQPLLLKVQSNRKLVVAPVIDLIKADSFQYIPSDNVRGGFNWGLGFTWEPIPPNSNITMQFDAYMSPTMAGGLFAMDRKYFFELGGYDEGMEIWGGENLEMSFRVWTCGGRLEIVPCSRVGHVFRTQSSASELNTDTENAVRVAEVWLDEYKEHFYAVKPHLRSNIPDVEQRKELRKKLKCKSFAWYLNTIYPEIDIPGVRASSIYFSNTKIPSELVYNTKVVNTLTQQCMAVEEYSVVQTSTVMLKDCDLPNIKIKWAFTADEIRVGKNLCVDTMLLRRSSLRVRLMKCHQEKAGQEWKFSASQHLYNPATGMCLGELRGVATMEICSKHSKHQKWKLVYEM